MSKELATAVVEGEGARNHYYIDSEVAFIQRFCAVRGIVISDFNRIHDEALTYLNSLKNGYGDCRAKLYPEFSEFISSWNGALVFSSEAVTQSLSHLHEIKSEIIELLSSLSEEMLNTDMDVIVEMNAEERQKHNALWFESRECYNSHYRHYDIPITAKEWFTERSEKINSELEFLTSIKDKTEAEMVEKYYFNSEDYESVFRMFEAQRGNAWGKALLEVAPKLPTEKAVRAYISIVLSVMHTWVSGLDLKHWFKVVTKSREWRKARVDREAE